MRTSYICPLRANDQRTAHMDMCKCNAGRTRSQVGQNLLEILARSAICPLSNRRACGVETREWSGFAGCASTSWVGHADDLRREITVVDFTLLFRLVFVGRAEHQGTEVD